MNHWLDSNRRRIAQDTFARLGWDDELFVQLFLSGLIRYHL